MELSNEKCVMVIDEGLPLGVIANTASILGISIGRLMPEIVGEDVKSGTGETHLGITTLPIPILKGNKELLKTLRGKLYEDAFSDVTVVDFSDAAQCCMHYEDFIDKISKLSANDLNYLGIAICGPKKKVNSLTGSMPLMR